MTVKERIENSEVYSFYARNPKHLEGTGLTAMQLVEAWANAEIVSKKARAINMVCEYLKAKYEVRCDDEQLRKVVTTAYEKVAYYERRAGYDFSNLSPIWRPWYQRLFQKRMHGDFDF